jgi:hypothetical protein
MPLTYHAGQIEVQQEANTRPVADMLASWVGPVGEFASEADLILLTTEIDEDLSFVAVSGQAPLVEVGNGAIVLPELPVLLPAEGLLAGGLAIDLAKRRRARVNGLLARSVDGLVLEAYEAFTNCRKYIAPSVALADGLHVGPTQGSPIDLGDAWLKELLSCAETAFLASMSPDGHPDVSHRGGPPGFLSLDGSTGTLTWPEYVGDGMLKSAGNVRATGIATLLVLDLATGDAAELSGHADFRTLRTNKEARRAALEQHRDPFPPQGEITLQVHRITRLVAFTNPRRLIETQNKITSCSPPEDQRPQ